MPQGLCHEKINLKISKEKAECNALENESDKMKILSLMNTFEKT